MRGGRLDIQLASLWSASALLLASFLLITPTDIMPFPRAIFRVPSMWSVRQLWSGDNSGLALAYFLAGLPDDGWSVLRGTLHRDMLQSAVPGQSGGSNGGCDFNDAVHPLSRAIVEGLFGYRPDYASNGSAGGRVIIAPQVPSSWKTAISLTTAEVQLVFEPATATLPTTTLSVNLKRPTARLELWLPVRATAPCTVNVTGLPPGAQISNETVAGIGQSVLIVSITAADGSATIDRAVVTAKMAGSIVSYVPSVYVDATIGETVSLVVPNGLTITDFRDPQGVLVAGSVAVSGDTLIGVVSHNATVGSHLVIVDAATIFIGTPTLPQTILFKLNLSDPAAALAALSYRAWIDEGSTAADWTFIPLDAIFNADLSTIFKPGTYTSPRPETCAERIGTDGWSAWTFPYWNGPAAPTPTFSNVANMSVGDGIIQTPQGARFLVNSSGVRNIAFTSLWDVYNASVNVDITTPVPGASSVWVLVAGSTNPMQTLIANAVLRFVYTDGSTENLELVPPISYWAISGWGSADYSYATDAFCLPKVPPPTVQLGVANRAMVYDHALPPGRVLAAVQLETLSQEVVVGLLAVSLYAPVTTR